VRAIFRFLETQASYSLPPPTGLSRSRYLSTSLRSQSSFPQIFFAGIGKDPLDRLFLMVLDAILSTRAKSSTVKSLSSRSIPFDSQAREMEESRYPRSVHAQTSFHGIMPNRSGTFCQAELSSLNRGPRDGGPARNWLENTPRIRQERRPHRSYTLCRAGPRSL
jgi:hypothetical protein